MTAIQAQSELFAKIASLLFTRISNNLFVLLNLSKRNPTASIQIKFRRLRDLSQTYQLIEMSSCKASSFRRYWSCDDIRNIIFCMYFLIPLPISLSLLYHEWSKNNLTVNRGAEEMHILSVVAGVQQVGDSAWAERRWQSFGGLHAQNVR